MEHWQCFFFSPKFGGEAANEAVIIAIGQQEVGSYQAYHKKGRKGGPPAASFSHLPF